MFLSNFIISYYDEFSCRTIGNAHKEKVMDIEESKRLRQEKRDCSARKEEDDFGSALSEARLCVNVWLAFGRQP